MKSQIQIFFITFTFLLTSCGSSQSQESSLTEVGSLPTATPIPLLEILPTPASIISFDSRVLATIKIFKEPDEMVFVDGYLWTKTADGHLVQIDPATNTITADIKLDTTTDTYHYCQGLGTDGEHIWACSAGGDLDIKTTHIMRVDPQLQNIVETIKVEKVFDQLDFPFLFNQIWVLSENGTRLTGIDIATNQVATSIDLGARCFQLAVVEEYILATCKLDNLLLQIDVEKMEVTSQVSLKNPGYVVGDENGIWVGLDNSIVRLNTKNLNPVATFTNMPRIGSSGDIYITNGAVWVRQEDNFLYKIDPATNQIVEQITIIEKLSGGSVLVTSDSIWVTANDDNFLIRLSLK